MKIIQNVKSIEIQHIDGSDGAPMKTIHLGRAAGSQKLYVNIDRLQPGAKSCKLHSHSHQEEFFMILRGGCLARIGEQSYRLHEGAFFAKPSGQGIAHQFINDTDRVVEILDIGTVDPNDVIEYPEEGVSYAPARGRAWRNGEELASWSSDPDGECRIPLSLAQTADGGIRIVPVSDEHRSLVEKRAVELFGGSTVVSKGILHDPARLPGFLAFRGDELAGLATYCINDESCQLVTIDAVLQHEGVGTLLLTAVERTARQAECRTVWLITTNDNLDALRFYQRQGYRITAVYPGAIEKSRSLKPAIPYIGNFDIAIRDEIELQKLL